MKNYAFFKAALLLMAPFGLFSSVVFSQEEIQDPNPNNLFFVPDELQGDVEYVRGIATDLGMEREAAPNSIASNYSKEVAYIRVVEQLRGSYRKGDGSHIVYMHISDEEYELLMPLVDELISDNFALIQIKEETACAELAFAVSSSTPSVDSLLTINNEIFNVATPAQISLLRAFKERVGSNLGEGVVSELDRFVSSFSKSIRSSSRNGLLGSFLLQGRSIEAYLSAHCN